MSQPTTADYNRSVFINCPFDDDYKPLFDALAFTVIRCGFVSRCARELQDTSQTRIDKIISIISECRYAIHDISRTELAGVPPLPRFNMPLELGIFLGAKHYGDERQIEKACLILDREQYRYQRFCSDLNGYDPESHNGDVRTAMTLARNWLRSMHKNSPPKSPKSARSRMETNDEILMRFFPPGPILFEEYEGFRNELATRCEDGNIRPQDLPFEEYTDSCAKWVRTLP